MKKWTYLFLAMIGFCNQIAAQSLPDYLPTDSLVAWFPFNGNADDESANGYDGTVNGAVLTSDRRGAPNRAYSFDASYISVDSFDAITGNSAFSISFWVRNRDGGAMIAFGSTSNGNGFTCGNNYGGSDNFHAQVWDISYLNDKSTVLEKNKYEHIVVVYDQTYLKVYKNTVLSTVDTVDYVTTNLSPGQLILGAELTLDQFLDGDLDDIAIYKRVLTEEEIKDLYISCEATLAINPSTLNISTGNDAVFEAIYGDPSFVYKWQTNVAGLGWLNIPENTTYSGSGTNELTVSDVQLYNHTQQFRLIGTAGTCVDTSEVSSIMVTDTCIFEVFDTSYVAVVDTLIINTIITGVDPPENQVEIKVYPNPATAMVNIDFGNYASISGYKVKVMNSLGQEVYAYTVAEQLVQVDVSTWGGLGLYIFYFLDDEDNLLATKKIIVQ